MSIAENLSLVRRQIEQACHRAGRPVDSVKLVAVSKTFGPDHIRQAIAAGQALFGENRVQEAIGKIEALHGENARFHLIGHLQGNKARRAVELFDAIESVDRVDLARKLNDVAAQANRRLPVLVQVHLGDEQTKHGVEPGSLNSLLTELTRFDRLHVQGLMAIPPLAEDPEKSRPYFRQLRELRDSWNKEKPHHALTELSMGMSGDFEVAIEEGATLVRVGTAIFGAR